MALRDDLLPVFEDARQLIQDFGLRRVRIIVRLGAWSTGETHLGALTNTDSEILPRPKVERRGGELIVSKITPSFATGGWEPADLQPAIAAGQDFYLVAIGDDGNQKPYRLKSVNLTKSFGYTLTLEQIDLVEPEY